uniref:Ig-like domain-containing protein n=1 Tax=Labrus bergylta TaxID=56723 RepID=A0A3Q3E710_9LABR
MKNHVSYPSTTTVQKSFWFTKVQDGEPVDLQTDSQYTGRVTYSSKSKDCTLTITNVGNSDSAVYKFRFITNHQDGSYTGDPGVTLSLTDLHVGTSRYSSWADLTCVSSCTLPPHSSYIWFKNGEKIPRKTSSTYSDYFEYADSYSCALQEHQDFPSPPVALILNKHAPKLPSVSVSPSAEIVEGSSVTLTCSSDANPAANYTWFKEDEDSPTASGQIFNINNTSPEHSGHYICIAQNTRGRHNSTVHLTVLEGNFPESPQSQQLVCHSKPQTQQLVCEPHPSLPRASANRVPSDPVPVLPSNSAPVLPNDPASMLSRA